MKAENVHAVLAACLDRPALLEAWRADPAAMRRMARANGVAPESFDLERIRAFGGSINLVRHSQLRAEIPNTFRLLSSLGLDIPLFADYAPRFVERRLSEGFDNRARLDALVAFLDEALDRDVPDQQLVWDLLSHETTLAVLRRSRPADRECSGSCSAVLDLSTVPVTEGRIRILETSCDPMALIAELERGVPNLAALVRRDHLFAYRARRGTLDLEVVETDPFTAYVLSLVDGTRSVAAIGQALSQLTGETLDSAELLEGMHGAREAGWLSFHSAVKPD